MTANEAARVLVVDDIADVAETLACLLEMDGYVVQTASSGEQALRVVDEFKPHCVLLDIGMPGMDGLDLTNSLRSRFGDDIVLIAITGGSSQDDERVSSTFNQVDHYLQKPIDPARLRKVLPQL